MTDNTTNKSKTNTYLISGIAVLGLVGVGVGIYSYSNPPINTVDDVEITVNSVMSDIYKDGTYNASMSYVSPGGTESFEITITIENDLIKSASFQGKTDNPTSTQYQNMFKSGFQKQIIDKNINDIKLKRVSGSSLTASAFNKALDKIKEQASE